MTDIFTATIAPKEEGKGRSFSAVVLATIDAPFLSPLGEGDGNGNRPVFAMFGGSDAELRPFVTNLRLGRKAILSNNYGHAKDRIEMLKSGDYQIAYQRESDGVIATIFLPDLFAIDPGMVDPTGIRFVMLPDKAWLEQQPDDVLEANALRDARKGMVAHCKPFTGGGGWRVDDKTLLSLAPLAHLAVAYLDRRSRCPIVADPRFYLQLLGACLDRGFASFPSESTYYFRAGEKWGHNRGDFVAYGPALASFGQPMAFSASHDDFEALLAAETTQFFAHIEGKLKPRKLTMPVRERPHF